MPIGDDSFDDALVDAENLLVNALNLRERDVDVIGLFQNALVTGQGQPTSDLRAGHRRPLRRRVSGDRARMVVQLDMTPATQPNPHV